MKLIIFEEADKIWKRLSDGVSTAALQFELEMHRQLLNFFQVGDYYYYIFNVKETVFDYVSHDITRVLGYTIDEIDVPFFVSNIHPEDQPWFLRFEKKAAEYFFTKALGQPADYKISYD